MRKVKMAGLSLIVLGMLTAPSRAAQPSPTDLGWLRGKTGTEAALAYQNGSSVVYLTELSTGQTTKIGSGTQPEFSPDGSKFAWISGTTAKGRMRKGDSTVRTIATGVRQYGVHWISNDEVAVCKGSDWFRVKLTGESTRINQMAGWGGSAEADVKLGSDGVWSWVSGTKWRTTDGRSGSTGGACSSSLAPDGRSVTGLEKSHLSAKLTRIRSGGYSGSLKWVWDYNAPKGFDNQRWSSNDKRFVVCQDEKYNYLVIMMTGSTYCTRMGQKGGGEMYGDFSVGAGNGAPWPGTGTTTNTPPSASISKPSGGTTVTQGDAVAYSGSATDKEDGTLTGSKLAWEYDISGDGKGRTSIGTGGSGSFKAPPHPNGTYPYTLTIYLKATDSKGLSSEKSVALSVKKAQTNLPPVVSAGLDVQATAGEPTSIQGTVSDDGKVTVQWTKDSGPGTVTFDNPNSVETGVTFDKSGDYVLRLTADDGALKSFDTIKVSVITMTLTLTSPQGGEAWTAGSTQRIKWTSAGVTDVKISYSTDNGKTWKSIVGSLDDTHVDFGNFPWTVPDEPTSQARIMVQEYFGNVPQTSGTFEITSGAPDTTAPKVQAVTLGLSGLVDDASVGAVKIGGIEFPVAGGAFSGDALLQGVTTDITVLATDGTGNTATRLLRVQ